MGYKLEGAKKNYKGKILVAIILWLLITIVFICPLSVAVSEALASGTGWNSTSFFQTFIDSVSNPFNSLGKCFLPDYFGNFIKCLGIVSLFYLGIVLIGFLKAMPKNEYQDIEHGSSDWSVKGEQYRVLSPDKGILLAEKNFLPLDKTGNTNVMVVGGSGSRKIFIIFYTKRISMLGIICFYRSKRRIIR